MAAPTPLKASTIQILKSTAPFVKANGTKITNTMYGIMIKRHPVVKNFFNMSHFNKRGDSMDVAPQVLINHLIK